jgi:TP901 family phage tail tape measure protein
VANRTVKVTIEANVTGAIANLKTLKGTLTDFGGELDKLGRKHKDQFNSLTTATAAVGVGLIGAFGLAARAAAGFDKEMSAVAAVSDASGKSLNALRQAALQAGKDTAFSATDAARAEEELAKAGVSTQQILGGALTGSLNLAAAGQMDLADAATISAQSMNIFKLSGAAVPHIADVLAASANKSAADMKGLGDALKQGGQVASQFGLSLEDTVGTLSLFADNALVGSDAGTSLKTMLTALANPSQQSAALMKQLGINAYDAQGKFVGIIGLAAQLQDKLGGLTQAQRDAALAQIFGTDAMRAANVLYKTGAAGLQNYIEAVDDSGAAAETARKKMDNLAGDIERLKGSLETMAISAGSGANTGLRALAQTADAAVSAFSDLPGPVQTAAIYMAGIGGAGLLATAGLLKARQSTLEALDSLRAMGPAGESAATGLGKVASIAGKVGLGLLALALAWEGAKLIGKLTGVDEMTKVTTHDIDAMTNAMVQFARTGKSAGELKKVFGDNMSALRQQIVAIDEAKRKLDALNQQSRFGSAASSVTGGGSAAIRQALLKQQAQMEQNIGEADKALAALVNAGNAAAANTALQRMADAAGMSVDQLTGKLPAYKQAIDGASLANSGLGQGFGSVAEQAGVMSRGLQDAIDHGLKLTDVFKLLNGAAVDWAHAEDNLEASFAAADQSIKNNGQTLDVHTEKGRANREALLGIVDATEAAIQAKFDETQSLDQANAVYEEGRKRLIAAAVAAGKTRQEAELLADQWLKMPPVASTRVETPGLAPAANRAQQLSDQLDRLNGKTATSYVNIITSDYRNSLRGNRWGGVTEHAQTGLLRDAKMFTATSPARYAFAEPATGGEAFIPRRGNVSRSRAIADYVVSNWLGGSTSWGGRPGGMGGGGYVDNRTVTYQINDATDPSRVVAAIATYERSNGKNWRK